MFVQCARLRGCVGFLATIIGDYAKVSYCVVVTAPNMKFSISLDSACRVEKTNKFNLDRNSLHTFHNTLKITSTTLRRFYCMLCRNMHLLHVTLMEYTSEIRLFWNKLILADWISTNISLTFPSRRLLSVYTKSPSFIAIKVPAF